MGFVGQILDSQQEWVGRPPTYSLYSSSAVAIRENGNYRNTHIAGPPPPPPEDDLKKVKGGDVETLAWAESIPRLAPEFRPVGQVCLDGLGLRGLGFSVEG